MNHYDGQTGDTPVKKIKRTKQKVSTEPTPQQQAQIKLDKEQKEFEQELKKENNHG